MNYLDNVRRLREIHNMSQSDLAEGICSQGMISKIEKHQVSPDIEIMIKIAKRFNLTVSQLIGQSAVGDTYDTIKNEIRRLTEKRDYYRLQVYLEEIHFESLSYRTDFRNWVHAMILYEVHGNTDDAIKLLKEALEGEEGEEIEDIEQHVVVLNALGSIYSNLNRHKQANGYFVKAFELQKHHQINVHLQRKLLFNMARGFYLMKDYIQSVFYARIGIRSTISEDSLFLLDDLYLLLANNYKRLNKTDIALEHAKQAEILAKIKGNEDIYAYIEKLISEIELQK